MPLKDKRQNQTYHQLYHQRQKEMIHNQAVQMIRETKKNFERDISANTTASEMLRDFSAVFNTTLCENELSRLPRQLIPNEPTDEIEEYFLTLARVDRDREREKLIQKMQFLDTMAANDDIMANLFVDDVVVAMDAKLKAKEAELALQKTRKQLKKKEPLPPNEAEPAPKPQATTSMWGSLFGAGGGGASTPSLKRARSR